METIFLQTIGISALMSMVVALVTTFILTGGSRGILNLFMGLYGFTIGWLYGMAWLFLTGGLTYAPLTMIAGIIITFIFVIIAYARLPDVISISPPKSETTSTIASIVSLVLIAIILLFAALPASYASSPTTVQMFTSADVRDPAFSLEVDDGVQDLWLAGATPVGSFVTIDKRLSAIEFPRLTSNPNEGDYLEVEIIFTVTGGGNWEQPYVKMAIVEDANNNGQPDSGEAVWPSHHSKFIHDVTMYMHWRSSVYWEGDSPGQQFIVAGSSGGQVVFIPFFHAKTITQWKNDASKTFSNTPEKYTPPFDQISWELSGGGLTPKEDITAFSIVSVGEQTSIGGKIYCSPDSKGNHLLLVMAFDLRYQDDPFDMSQTPIAQSILTFSVGGDTPPPPPPNPPVVEITTNSWVAATALGLGTIGMVWYGKKRF